MGAVPPTVTRPTLTGRELRRGWLIASLRGRGAGRRHARGLPGRHLPLAVFPQPDIEVAQVEIAGLALVGHGHPGLAPYHRHVTENAQGLDAGSGRDIVTLACGQRLDERGLAVQVAIRVCVLE